MYELTKCITLTVLYIRDKQLPLVTNTLRIIPNDTNTTGKSQMASQNLLDYKMYVLVPTENPNSPSQNPHPHPRGRYNKFNQIKWILDT